MFRILFLLFVIVPIIEITVLMHVGAWLGAWPTIGIVIFTAWLGAKNVRQQGLATLNSVQTKMAHGEMPSNEIIAGIMLLVAGVLLLTPGFVTDAFGLSLLVPAVRQSLIKTVKQHFVVNQMSQSPFGFQASSSSSTERSVNETSINQQKTPVRTTSSEQGETIEGEFERKD
ncbi:MAG: FxsA family protein [Alteromonadaceae bacterium]|nr:FxsA family protein [Alteromonadaceae bacterium]